MELREFQVYCNLIESMKSLCLACLKMLVTIKNKLQRTRWQRSRWTWTTSLSTDTSEILIQTQKCMQNTS